MTPDDLMAALLEVADDPSAFSGWAGLCQASVDRIEHLEAAIRLHQWRNGELSATVNGLEEASEANARGFAASIADERARTAAEHDDAQREGILADQLACAIEDEFDPTLWGKSTRDAVAAYKAARR